MTDADAEADIITLRLYREEYSGKSYSRNKAQRRFLLNIKVFKHVLASTSTYFEEMLSGGFSRTGMKEIDIKQEHADAFVLWMRIFHGTVSDDDYLIPIVVIWHAVRVKRFFFFEVEPLSTWFSE